jgi:hypothetical protein
MYGSASPCMWEVHVQQVWTNTHISLLYRCCMWKVRASSTAANLPRTSSTNTSSTRMEGGSPCSTPNPAVRSPPRAEVRRRDTPRCPCSWGAAEGQMASPSSWFFLQVLFDKYTTGVTAPRLSLTRSSSSQSVRPTRRRKRE